MDTRRRCPASLGRQGVVGIRPGITSRCVNGQYQSRLNDVLNRLPALLQLASRLQLGFGTQPTPQGADPRSHGDRSPDAGEYGLNLLVDARANRQLLLVSSLTPADTFPGSVPQGGRQGSASISAFVKRHMVHYG